MTQQTTPPVPHVSSRSRQGGATLIVGLVLLLVLTVVGVSGMNTATMEVTMSGNTQFQQDAFQMAEDGIDLAIGRREYGTDADRTIDWLPDDPAANRRAVTSFEVNLPVATGPAFSGSAVEAFHFEIRSEGLGPRNAESTHVQGFYVVARAL
jgi:type IV pilus assembly protein PilX